ncbi:cytochrome P450 [Streptomyces aidingensis]|uniref:Cytochrome P450 n=1 Tax=Streptomyces aidingensis TaxID=910347 RepID=A0A1I1FRL1_9ACTN|nr:cytochrome P450 [Streptomyces aidingensis]SFC01965.1 Cytochrome P450 [Streptomyces aidingensis]
MTSQPASDASATLTTPSASAGPPGPSAPPARSAEPLYGAALAGDAQGLYARLRLAGPIAPVELAPGVRAMLVTSYDTALRVLRSPELFSKDPRRWRDLAEGRVPPDSPVLPMMVHRPNALWSDGPGHQRLRQAITDSLDRVEPAELRACTEQSADTLIDRFAPDGTADLLNQYAKVLPLLVFNRLFGCPADYGDLLVEGMSGIFDGRDTERCDRLLTTTAAGLVALKRREPGPDVVTRLIGHPAGLTDEELVHQLVLLLGAGTEPEQNLIANTLRLLLADERFAASVTGGQLPVEDALDEVLWKDPPLDNYAVHYPVRDLEIDGVALAEGVPVVISFAAANTDPGHASPQRAGNRAHLAWSAGPHACPAQGQARLIATVAVERLLDRLPEVELAVPEGELARRPGPFHRALAALPVRFPPEHELSGAGPGPRSAPESVPESVPVPAPAAAGAPPPGCPAHRGRGAAEPLYGYELAGDAQGLYARLRLAGPAAPVELAPGVRAMLVTSYDMALRVLRSPELFSKDPRRWRDLAEGRVPPDSPVLPMMCYRPIALFTDGEEHRRLRAAVTDSLDRVDSAELRLHAEQSADTLIDRFAPDGRADLVSQYARMLPLLVFTRLFDCPPGLGGRLVDSLAAIFDGRDARANHQRLVETAAALVRLRRQRPGTDVLSSLITHPSALTDEELVHQLSLLMSGGTEPEQNLIANALRLLLADERFALGLAGGQLPVEDALDEVLWQDPPLDNYAIHYPVRDVEIDGVRFPAGAPVVISFAAANTDPGHASPQRAGNRAHLAWSAGPHACPAQGQARLIATVAVERLLDRLPEVELAVPEGELARRPGPFHRALAALPVRFPPTAGEAAGPDAPPAPGPRPAPDAEPAPSGAAGGGPDATAAPPRGRALRRTWTALGHWWRGGE